MMVRLTQPLEGDKSAATVPSQGRFFAVKFYRPDTGTWQRFVVDAFFLADVSMQPHSLVAFASLPPLIHRHDVVTTLCTEARQAVVFSPIARRRSSHMVVHHAARTPPCLCSRNALSAFLHQQDACT